MAGYCVEGASGCPIDGPVQVGLLARKGLATMTELSNEQLEAAYYEGLGLLKAGHLGRAVEVLRPSVDAGDRASTVAIAIAFLRSGDVNQALKYYELAAIRGTPNAAAYLGYLYKVMGDTAQARAWLSRAASMGHPVAAQFMESLDFEEDPAQMVFFNAFGDRYFAAGNVDSAVKAWMSACDFGSADAMVKIGDVLLSQGVVGEAKLYFARASSMGNALGRERLSSLG